MGDIDKCIEGQIALLFFSIQPCDLLQVGELPHSKDSPPGRQAVFFPDIIHSNYGSQSGQMHVVCIMQLEIFT